METGTRSATLLDILGDETWDEIRAQMTLRTFAPGEMLIHQGTLEPDFHVVVNGLVRVEAAGLHGQRRELGTLGTGDCIGDMALLTLDPASADVVATTHVTTYGVAPDKLAAMGPLRSKLMEGLAQLLASRLRFANERLLAQHAAPNRGIYCTPETIHALVRLPAEVARVVDAPVLAIIAGDTFDDLSIGDAMSLENVAVWKLSDSDLGDLPRLLRRVAHEYDEVLVFGRPGALTHIAADLTTVVEVVHEGGNPASSIDTPLVVLSERRWNVPELSRLSRLVHHPVVAIVPAVSPPRGPRDPVAKLARTITNRQVGLALGAGAAKGLSHLGVLRAFVERDIPIDVITGCSIGSAIAAGYAVGYSIDELTEMVAQVAARALRPTVPLHSFLSNRGIRDELERVGRSKSFEDLEVPLAICAVDIFRRCEVTFTTGLVWPRILASMAIPGVYPALKSGDSYLVDGSVLTPVPARQARELGAGIVLGVRLTGSRTSPRDVLDFDPSRPLAADTITRCFEIMHNRLSELSQTEADAIIEVRLDRGGLRDFDRAKEYAESGYQATIEAIDTIATVLPYVRENA